MSVSRGAFLNLCSFQADSFFLLSVTVGLLQREGEDVEVVAELLHLEMEENFNGQFLRH